MYAINKIAHIYPFLMYTVMHLYNFCLYSGCKSCFHTHWKLIFQIKS